MSMFLSLLKSPSNKIRMWFNCRCIRTRKRIVDPGGRMVPTTVASSHPHSFARLIVLQSVWAVRVLPLDECCKKQKEKKKGTSISLILLTVKEAPHWIHSSAASRLCVNQKSGYWERSALLLRTIYYVLYLVLIRSTCVCNPIISYVSCQYSMDGSSGFRWTHEDYRWCTYGLYDGFHVEHETHRDTPFLVEYTIGGVLATNRRVPRMAVSLSPMVNKKKTKANLKTVVMVCTLQQCQTTI